MAIGRCWAVGPPVASDDEKICFLFVGCRFRVLERSPIFVLRGIGGLYWGPKVGRSVLGMNCCRECSTVYC